MHFDSRFTTLVEIFQEAVTKYGGRDLFGTKKDGRWTWITYGEFASLVDRLRGGLASLGVERGDRVAIIANNRVEWAVAAFACYGLGAAYVPMYEAQSPKDWEFIVHDSEAKVLLVAGPDALAKTRRLVETIPSLRTLVLLDQAVKGGEANGSGPDRVVPYAALLSSGRSAPSIRAEPGDTAGLIYTSGTTGNPKGVILTHSNIASNVSAIHAVFSIEIDDRSLAFLPWAHVFGQTVELYMLLSSGASIAISEGPDKILDDLAEVRPTLIFSVPRIFNKIYTAVQKQILSKPKPVQTLVRQALGITAKERNGERLKMRELAVLKLVDRMIFSKVRARFGGRLKYAFSGGAALSQEVAEFIDSLGVVVYEGYGLTETSPLVAANIPGARKIGSVGRPLVGVRVEIDPASGEDRRVPDGTSTRFEGEILVYGPNVMKGYLNRPDENAAVFTADGGFRTGDMGYLDPQGYLFLTGRLKEQYKLENGKYVVPTPLEEQLKLSSYVANAMVYGDNRPYNVAILVANVAAIRAWAKETHLGLPADEDGLLKDGRVRALFQSEIERLGAAFKGFEAVREFALIPADFTTENGMLTPSLKLKRRVVVEAYAGLIDRMYAKASGAKPSSISTRG